ncbi:uncharacterized protein aq_1476-like [Macrobrachium rosenbergii]|uniref:uncharacterized protein aq_1476-like n=1 Tax=Macrobrachium rosenbergii TaxID=79674 RepID=UPI0034D73BDF
MDRLTKENYALKRQQPENLRAENVRREQTDYSAPSANVLQKEVSNLRGQDIEMEIKTDRIKREKIECEETISDLEKEVQDLVKQYEKIKTEVSDLKQELTNLQEESLEKDVKIDQLIIENMKLVKTISRLEETVHNLVKENEEIETELQGQLRDLMVEFRDLQGGNISKDISGLEEN